MAVRIDIRPDEESKARLDRAAAKLGLPLSSFVLSAALERAQEVLAREARVLSDRDRDRVMALLEGRPVAPNAALRKAMKRHAGLLKRQE
ncbi:MAG: type II toxin-antitoxin system TacA family antitoxin [Myxococcaceae bacterium]